MGICVCAGTGLLFAELKPLTKLAKFPDKPPNPFDTVLIPFATAPIVLVIPLKMLPPLGFEQHV